MPSNKNANRLFLVTVLIYLGASFLISMFSAALEGVPVAGTLIFSQALVVAPSLIYCMIRRVPVKELIPFRKMKFSVCVLVVVCTYLMYPLIIVLNALTLFFVPSGTMGLMTPDISLPVMTLCVAVLPAFAEEFVFRGMLFSTYKRSKMLPAIFLSAFLFGCIHLNLNQFAYAFALGIYLAFLVEATGSIFSSMLAHFTINFTGVLVNALMTKVTELSGQEAGDGMTGMFLNTLDETTLVMMIFSVVFWAAVALGTTAGGIGVYIAIAKISKRWEHVKGMFREGTRERMVTLSVIAAILLTVAFMAYQVVGYYY